MAANNLLRPQLYGWQIFFIAISAVIGGGVFNSNGEALEVAGPGGMLVTMGIMGIVAMAVMEGVSEMTQLFPAPNAVVEYVRAFVDKDLGWVVGVAYWYTYASCFATQSIAAGNLMSYWSWSQRLKVGVFYCAAPVIIFLINYLSVWLYGMIESIGGMLKIALVTGSSILLFVVAKNSSGVDQYRGNGYINDGFRNKEGITMNFWTAMCFVAPVVAYAFIGVEVVTIAAFESRLPRDPTIRSGEQDTRRSKLSFWEVPSRSIGPVACVLYMFCTMSEALNVKWTDSSLPVIYGSTNATTVTARDMMPAVPPAAQVVRSHSMVIIALLDAGHLQLAGFLNGCLLFSVLSAGNTSMYIASRTLYGLARKAPKGSTFGKWFGKLSIVDRVTYVPGRALLLSALAFCWLPFIYLIASAETGGAEPATQQVFEIIGTSASVSCMLVWACLCLAFIRYKKWIDKFKNDAAWKTTWKRAEQEYGAYTYFGATQPLPAYLGLVGCIVIVAFASATWWTTDLDANKFLSAFLAPLIFISIYALLKFLRYFKIGRWDNNPRWVELTNDSSILLVTIDNLRRLRKEQEVDENLRLHGIVETLPRDETRDAGAVPLVAVASLTSRHVARPSASESQLSGYKSSGGDPNANPYTVGHAHGEVVQIHVSSPT